MTLKLSKTPPADLLRDAYESHLDEMHALSDAHVIPRLNVDLPSGVSIVLGALPRLMTLREEIRTQLPRMPHRYVDALESYCYAALYAHMGALTAPGADNRIVALMEKRRTAAQAAHPRRAGGRGPRAPRREELRRDPPWWRAPRGRAGAPRGGRAVPRGMVEGEGAHGRHRD